MSPTVSPHCGRETCTCSHQFCFKGWRDHDGPTTVPCRECRPRLHDIIIGIPHPGHRNAADLAALSRKEPH